MNYKLITLIAIACFFIALADLWHLKDYQNWHLQLRWFGWLGVIGLSICLITLVFVPLFRKRK